MSGELMYDDNGQPVGYLATADDGSFVLHDGQGTVLDAATADGQPLDPAGYSMGTDEGPGVAPQGQPLDEMTQRVAALEAQAQQTYQPPPQHADPVNWDELGHQLDDAKSSLGRNLTSAEHRAVVDGLDRQVQRGEAVNVGAALDAGYATGAAKYLDMSTRQGKADFVMDRLEQENPPPTPPAEQEFDASTREGKVGYVMARLNGAEADDGSDAPEAA